MSKDESKKIHVTNEGREGAYLITKEEATRVVTEYPGEEIHHQFQNPPMFLGADHSKEDVLEDIQKAEKLAIITEPNFTMRHHLVLIFDNKRHAYDIGEVKTSDLVVEES